MGRMPDQVLEADAGCGHSPLLCVSIPQFPPWALFPASSLVALYLSPLNHCQDWLCAGRGGSDPWPHSPRPLATPRSHLLAVVEAEPDGLGALVVGDGLLQGACLPGPVHPDQVGTSVAGLALPLWGEPTAPGHHWEMGGPQPCVYPSRLTSASSQL